MRVCEYFHALSRSCRVHKFWVNYMHVCAKENTKNSFWSVSTSTKATKKREKSIYSFCVPLNKKSLKLMMSVFCSNSLLHAPECGKCILRDPNFQNFPGEHAPQDPPRSSRLTVSFSISPSTSQILPSTPFLIENPDILLKWFMEVETKLFIVQTLYKPLHALMLVHWQVIGHCPIPLLLFHVKFSLTIINFY